MLPADGMTKANRAINPISTSATTNFEDSWHMHRSFPAAGLVQLARDARLLMLIRDRSVSIWRLLRLQNREGDSDELGLQALLADPTASQGGWDKVLDMQLNVSTNLCCGSISDDGRWLAVADMYETKLFRLEHQDEVRRCLAGISRGVYALT
jgi:U3 small nucleolar RNA-associated protein 4